MATSKTLELSIKIAGRMDKSLTAAINGTQSKIGSLTKSISNIGTVGLATMGAVATAAAVGIAGCTKEAQALESAMAPVVRYVDGLADASGAVSDAIADNGKTFKQNYGALKAQAENSLLYPLHGRCNHLGAGQGNLAPLESGGGNFLAGGAGA